MFNRFGFLIITILTIAGNFFVEYLQLGGETSASISDRLTTLITPAGFTFSIRSVIYLGILIVWVLIAIKKIKIDTKTTSLYLASWILNCGWLVARHFQIISLSVLIIVWLLFSLILLIEHIKHSYRDSYLHKALLLYFGRVMLATLICITAYLNNFVAWFAPFNLYRSIWCIILAWTLNSLIMIREKTIITSLVLLRALYGIYAAQTDPTILYSSKIIWIIILCQICYVGVVRLIKKITNN